MKKIMRFTCISLAVVSTALIVLGILVLTTDISYSKSVDQMNDDGILIFLHLLVLAASAVTQLLIALPLLLGGGSALLFDFLANTCFSPKNGKFKTYRVLMVLAYFVTICSVILVFLFALDETNSVFMSILLFLTITVIFTVGYGFSSLNEIKRAPLCYFDDLIINDTQPAMIFDPEYRIHLMNEAAENYYEKKDVADMIGISVLAVIAKEHADKLDIIVRHHRFDTDIDKSFLCRSENDRSEIYIIPIKSRKKAVIGYVLRHEASAPCASCDSI